MKCVMFLRGADRTCAHLSEEVMTGVVRVATTWESIAVLEKNLSE